MDKYQYRVMIVEQQNKFRSAESDAHRHRCADEACLGVLLPWKHSTDSNKDHFVIPCKHRHWTSFDRDGKDQAKASSISKRMLSRRCVKTNHGIQPVTPIERAAVCQPIASQNRLQSIEYPDESKPETEFDNPDAAAGI